jgi:hypothetical protein
MQTEFEISDHVNFAVGFPTYTVSNLNVDSRFSSFEFIKQMGRTCIRIGLVSSDEESLHVSVTTVGAVDALSTLTTSATLSFKRSFPFSHMGLHAIDKVETGVHPTLCLFDPSGATFALVVGQRSSCNTTLLLLSSTGEHRLVRIGSLFNLEPANQDWIDWWISDMIWTSNGSFLALVSAFLASRFLR